MSNISTWSTTAASNNASPPDGFPEGQTAGSLNNSGRELMAAMRRWYEDAQWIDYGDTPTFVNGASFRVAGDLTARYIASRRIRGANSGADIYGEILSSSYTNPNTTVTVTWDSGSLTASVSAVAVGILQPGQTAPVSFPSGTRMAFVQATAPTGWTIDTTWADYCLRVSSSISATFAGGSWTITDITGVATGVVSGSTDGVSPPLGNATDGNDAGFNLGDHPHDVSISFSTSLSLVGDGNWRPQVVDCILATKD